MQCSFVEGAPFHETADKQASGPHTNILGQEIKSQIQMTAFELMTYTGLMNYDVPCKRHLKL